MSYATGPKVCLIPALVQKTNQRPNQECSTQQPVRPVQIPTLEGAVTYNCAPKSTVMTVTYGNPTTTSSYLREK